MRVGFVGNTNNYPLMLALALSRLGHEIIFIVDRNEPLHRPEFYTSKKKLAALEIVESVNVITSFLDFFIHSKQMKVLISHLNKCDVIYVNGLWPIIALKLNKPYFCLLTGSDLELYGDPYHHMRSYWDQLKGLNPFKKIPRTFLAGLISLLQIKAIEKSSGFSYFPKGIIPNGDRLLSHINSSKRFSLIMGDTYRFQQIELPSNDKLRFFMVARHEWTLPLKKGKTYLDLKGNDVFFRGLYLFTKNTGIKIDLILVSKGSDVENSKVLIRNLKLQDQVTWLDEMSQQEVYEQYKKADIVIDQLSQSIVGMGGLDAMAIGRPLLANGRPEIYRPLIGVDSPICQASSPEEVSDQILKLTDPLYRKEIADLSRIYVEKYFSSDSAAVESLKAFRNA